VGILEQSHRDAGENWRIGPDHPAVMVDETKIPGDTLRDSAVGLYENRVAEAIELRCTPEPQLAEECDVFDLRQVAAELVRLCRSRGRGEG
jgi:hypothetical protein